MKEQEAREKVKGLRGFLGNMVRFFLVNALFIFIWFMFDSSGTFWPKYVLLVWGIGLVIQGYREGVLILVLDYLSFLTPEWEEKKIEELTDRQHIQRKIRLNRDAKK